MPAAAIGAGGDPDAIIAQAERDGRASRHRLLIALRGPSVELHEAVRSEYPDGALAVLKAARPRWQRDVRGGGYKADEIASSALMVVLRTLRRLQTRVFWKRRDQGQWSFGRLIIARDLKVAPRISRCLRAACVTLVAERTR